MANTSLTPELVALVKELAAGFAASQKVVAAKARIGVSEASDIEVELISKSDYVTITESKAKTAVNITLLLLIMCSPVICPK